MIKGGNTDIKDVKVKSEGDIGEIFWSVGMVTKNSEEKKEQCRKREKVQSLIFI